ncbi:MAG: hypothetical protein R8M45_11530 [Ghiorsea sp.]
MPKTNPTPQNPQEQANSTHLYIMAEIITNQERLWAVIAQIENELRPKDGNSFDCDNLAAWRLSEVASDLAADVTPMDMLNDALKAVQA